MEADFILKSERRKLYCAHPKSVNLGCAKAPRIDDRKLACIGLILTNLRSSILGSFRASRNSHFWGGRSIEQIVETFAPW